MSKYAGTGDTPAEALYGLARALLRDKKQPDLTTITGGGKDDLPHQSKLFYVTCRTLEES